MDEAMGLGLGHHAFVANGAMMRAGPGNCDISKHIGDT